MNARYATALILSCSIFGVAMGAASQGPSSRIDGGPVVAQKVSHAKPKNIEVLPKDISGDDVDKLMHRYEQDLGVPCGYCHEENPQTKQIDFASDENPIKQTARMMIAMTSDLNTKYLAQLGDRRYAEPLTCGNCHQGQVEPPIFEPRPQR